MNKRLRPHPLYPAVIASLAAVLSVRAQNDDVSNEYRLSLFGYHKITHELTGMLYLDYSRNPDNQSHLYRVGWPAVNHSVNSWLQIWTGLFNYYTEKENASDTVELRPFIGPKLFLPNKLKWSIFNYTRYEYRDTLTLDTGEWTAFSRLRSRFGIEIPFTSRERAWKEKSWYGLADVEPLYRFDHNQIDPLRFRCGLGYVLNERVTLEFIYTAQFARSHGELEYNQNTFRLNIRIATSKGILGRVLGWSGHAE